jgi:hypothetical protein
MCTSRAGREPLAAARTARPPQLHVETQKTPQAFTDGCRPGGFYLLEYRNRNFRSMTRRAYMTFRGTDPIASVASKQPSGAIVALGLLTANPGARGRVNNLTSPAALTRRGSPG